MIAQQIAQASSIETAAQLKRRMTYEEFLAWADEDVHAEWKDGKVTVHIPQKPPHQILSQFLSYILGLYIRIRELGRLYVAPIEVKLWSGGPAREPDLVFVSNDHLDRVTAERIIGAPDLVVEIVSDDSVHRDRVDKLDDYETIGVSEYWIIDNRLNQNRAWFYRLDQFGQYQLVPIGPDGIFHSEIIPGFWLRLGWLWVAQPNELRALAEIVGPDEFAQAMQRALRSDEGIE